MEMVRADQIRDRIKRLERQIHDLDTAMIAHRKWTHPWMRHRETIRRLEAEKAMLTIMLETLEPGSHASG